MGIPGTAGGAGSPEGGPAAADRAGAGSEYRRGGAIPIAITHVEVHSLVTVQAELEALKTGRQRLTEQVLDLKAGVAERDSRIAQLQHQLARATLAAQMAEVRLVCMLASVKKTSGSFPPECPRITHRQHQLAHTIFSAKLPFANALLSA